MNKNTIFYLCDGDIPTCRKDECYKRGGECRHTTDAIKPEKKPPLTVGSSQGRLCVVRRIQPSQAQGQEPRS